MANNFDRQATKGLYGLTSAKNVWNKPPTTISPPANGPRLSAPSSTNTHNPFNIMGKKPRHTNNATSERTPLGRADLIRGPPSKRRKVDDPTSTAVHHSRIRKADRLPLAPDPEPTFVDLEAEDAPSDDLNIRPSHDATSEHETRLSKYYVEQQSSYRGYTVAQDGEEFKEMKARFSNSIDSDPIEESTPDDCPIGIVKRRVENYENGPKVDFTKVTTKSKMKGKIFTAGFGPVGTPAPSSILRNVDLYDSIPIECLYKNQELVESTQGEIRMYATPDGALNFMFENKRLFAFPIKSREQPIMIHPNSGISVSPVIQFKSQGSNTDLVTIRLDTNHSDWEQRKYIKFTKFLEKVGVKLESMRNTDILWQLAKDHAGVLTKETGGGKHNPRPFESYQALNRSREVREIQVRRKDRSLGPPPPASSRDSLSTNPGRGGPDLNLETSRCASPLNLQFESSVSLSEIGPAPSAYKPKPEIRSTRSRTKVESNEKSVENPEEVILSYPAGLPGAVNITNADVDRLAPGNFLNDTLIEFSLKLWLKDLEASNPELARQIHVFNSFFYKKLNVRKDSQVAYESIRKWTSKIDIFKKKYIIVPINEHMHWYLAIIYEPEHILKASPVDGNLPRPHTRQSTSRAAPVSNPNFKSLGPREGSLETYTEAQDLHSEAEIERSLNDFGSCFITSPDTIMTSPPKSDNHSDIYGDEPMSDVDMYFDETANVTPDILRLSPSVSDFGKNVQQHRSCSMDSMAAGESGEAAGPSVALQNKPVKTDGAIEATSFYQPAGVRKQYKGKKRVQNGSDSPEIKVDAEEEGGVLVVDDKPKTYIFTFDSLGGRHPQAIKKLSAYLKMEAKDKKGIDNAAVADGKTALVPCQPNFCDCGIYLLHFAKTFMNDATRYATTILTSKPKAVSIEERSRVWCENEIQGSKGRNKLRLRIEELSSEWKKLRIETMEHKPLDDVKKVQSEESEGEVELVESDSGRKVVSRARKAVPAVRVRG